MKKRRILAWFMAMVMAIGLLPATAFAAASVTLIYNTKDGTTVHELTGTSTNGNIEPEYIWEGVDADGKDKVYVAFVVDANDQSGKTITEVMIKNSNFSGKAIGNELIINDELKTHAKLQHWEVFAFDGAIGELIDASSNKIVISWKTGQGGWDGNGISYEVSGWPPQNFNIEKSATITDAVSGSKKDTVCVNDKVTYTITLTNKGSLLTHAIVTVKDSMFPEIAGDITAEDAGIIVDITNGGYDSSHLTGKMLNITVKDLQVGGTISITYTHIVTDGDIIEVSGKQVVKNVARVVNGDGPKDVTLDIPVDTDDGGNTDPTYTVTFESNGGTGTMPVQEVPYNTATALNQNTFTRDGYKFTGWNTNTDGSGILYADEASVTLTKDLTLYAQWEKIPTDTVTLIYDANDGTGTMSVQEVPYNTETPLDQNTFTRDDYKFTGWNTNADGSGANYADKASVTLTKDLTLYAQWEKIPTDTVTLTYDANGGTGTMSAATENKGTEVVVAKNGFTAPDGYEFNGWNTEKNPTDTTPGSAYKPNDEITLNNDITLYAQWIYVGEGAVQVTGKVRIADANTVPTDVTWVDGTAPQGVNDEATPVIYPDTTVKLLYKVTVVNTNQPPAVNAFDLTPGSVSFTVTDAGAEFVGYEGNVVGAPTATGSSTVTGTIAPNGTVELYFTKEFNFDEVTDGEVTNAISDTVKDETPVTQKVRVTFDKNADSDTVTGMPDTPQELDKGTAATKPETPPVRDGYDFVGWFTDKAGNTKYNFNNEVENDIILYAQWIKEGDLKIQKIRIDDKTLVEGEIKAALENADVEYGDNLQIKTGETITLLYMVRVGNNASDLLDEDTTQTSGAKEFSVADEGATYIGYEGTISDPDVSKADGVVEGMLKAGEYIDIYYTKTFAFNDIEIIDGNVTVAKNTATLNDETKPGSTDETPVTQKVTLNYDANGSNAAVPGNTEYNKGTNATVEAAITRDGYEFVGWNTAADGSGTDVTADGTYIMNEDTTLYAQWQRKGGYTVTYYNGNTKYNDTTKYLYKDTVIVKSTNDCGFTTPAGKVFLGWSTTEGSANVTYAAGKRFSITKDTDLYAIWGNADTDKVTLTYHRNHDTNDAVNASETYEKKQSGTITQVKDAKDLTNFTTPTGCEFVGWNTAADGSGGAYALGSIIALDKDTDLYAQWRKIYTYPTYTVTYNANGGSGTAQSFDYPKGGNVSVKTDIDLGFTRNNYNFLGWSKDPNATVADSQFGLDDTFEITENTTLYAIWGYNGGNGNNNHPDVTIQKELKYVDKNADGKFTTYKEGTKVDVGDVLRYEIKVTWKDLTQDSSIEVEDTVERGLKNGKFVGVKVDKEILTFREANDEDNKNNVLDVCKLEKDGNTVTLDKIREWGEIVLIYEGTVTSNSKDKVVNTVEAKAEKDDKRDNATETTWIRTSGGGGSHKPSKPSKPVPPALNGDDHFQYVQGYPDGTVGPERNITRAEATVIFFRLLKDDVRESYLDVQNSFPDVRLADWFNVGVSTMENGNFVSGYKDGYFRPNGYITRAELAVIISNFDDLEASNNTRFADARGHWAEKYINSAAEKGWISGYDDGLFRPNQFITRAETMSMINRVLQRRVDADGLHKDAHQWRDNKPGKWYYYDVLEATNHHDYERADDELVENWTAINPDKIWEN